MSKRRPIRRFPVAFAILATLTVLVTVAGIVSATFGRELGWGLAPLLAEAVPFHALLIAISTFAALSLLALALLLPQWRRRTPLAVAVILAVVLSGMTVTTMVKGSRTVSVASVPASSSPNSLRILSWNTDQASVSEQQLESLIRQTKPDIVVLPEYFPHLAKTQLAGLAHGAGMRILGWDSSAASIMIPDSLGSYKLSTTGVPAWAGFAVEPATPGSRLPTLVVAHLQHPSLNDTVTWRQHLDWITRACQGPNVIAIGDFNASVANVGDSLGQCRDAASILGDSAVGTWPTELPAFLGAQIDHVMFGAAWYPTYFAVLSGIGTSGSDHRPIFAVLSRAL